jgi:hypothetical protein
VDIFNIFNFQTPTAYDQNYTYSPVLPIVGGNRSDLPGKVLDAETGQPIAEEAVNKNFGKPTAYQAPRSFRFGARLTF